MLSFEEGKTIGENVEVYKGHIGLQLKTNGDIFLNVIMYYTQLIMIL